MSLVLKISFIAICLFSFVFASWHVLHGNIEFSADIGRDFHLLQEIDAKKIILIGPRSSSGLFHGPVWLYLNYPAYLIGQGNPLIVGWFWVILSLAFVVSNFFIAKNLFGKLSAYFFTAAIAVYMGFHSMGLFNPHGAMFLLPFFFFCFIKYLRTQKLSFLLLHLISGGLILQFQLAIGIPLLILSGAFLSVFFIRSGKRIHVLALLLLPILISNFILFDLRHEFLYTNKMLAFISMQQSGHAFNYLTLIPDRLATAFMKMEILRHDPYAYLNFAFFISMLVLMSVLIRQNKYKDVYLSFFYFYFGFFLLSFINKGNLLYFYYFPFVPLIFLMLASFVSTKYKQYVIVPLVIILTINCLNAINDMRFFSQRRETDTHSWKFFNNATEKMFLGDEEEFGYFVFSPDVVAYEGRYAMLYAAKTHKKTVYPFTKRPVTYLFIAPTLPNEYVTGDEYWKKQQIYLDKKPAKIISFPNGYKLEKYYLTEEEMAVPFNPNINPGILFR